MKKSIVRRHGRCLWLNRVLGAAALMLGASIASAQNVQVLHSFTQDPNGMLGLVQSSTDGSLFGTAQVGGPNNQGTVFKLTPDGAGGYTSTTLLAFDGAAFGGIPLGLTRGSDGQLYGVTEEGGANGVGTAYKITESGDYTALANFSVPIGDQPLAPLSIGGDGNFYGCTVAGGSAGSGTVFRMTPAGSITTLASFSSQVSGRVCENAIRASDGNVYGITIDGGSAGMGNIFKVVPSTGALTTLYSFTGAADGENPGLGLIQGSDGNIYGTTRSSQTSGDGGSVFKVTLPAATVSIIHTFQSTTAGLGAIDLVQGSDAALYVVLDEGGASNAGGIARMTTAGASYTLLSSFTCCSATGVPVSISAGTDGALYGTLNGGGVSSGGVFKVKLSPVGVTIPFTFARGAEGNMPQGNLVQIASGDLIGTTSQGGTSNGGTLFKIDANNVVTTLHEFNTTDGAAPQALFSSPAFDNGTVYGVTAAGGASGRGVIFKWSPTGGYSVVHSFSTSEGQVPVGALVGSTTAAELYGTTLDGGVFNEGTVFKVTTSGTMTVLHSFTNGDGAQPQSGVVVGSDGNIYGTTIIGGFNYGTLFRINPAGVFSVLHFFTYTDGANPYGALTLGAHGTIYGTTGSGATANAGTVFRFDPTTGFSTVASLTGSNGNTQAGVLDVELPATDPDYPCCGALFGIGSSGLFRLGTDGSGLTTVATLSNSLSEGSLVKSAAGPIYGETYGGGSGAAGSIFSFQPAATVSFSNTAQTYDGTAKSPTATTIPSGLSVSLTYTQNGSPVSAPESAGTYVATATVNDPGYSGSASTSFVINKGTPTITWSDPSPIAYPTPLGPTQFNATANVPGTFSYAPPAGTIVPVGTAGLAATFTPTDVVDYTTATKSVNLTITSATPTITWANPAAITYGAALGASQLNAIASTPGTLTYTPALGTVLNAGSAQTLHVDFAPTDAVDYAPASKDVTINVNKATPVITWANAAAIGYGTPLGGTQLNANANVPGTFAYTPAAGAVLNAGTGQTLHVVFTPTDSANYATASKDVTIDVNQATPVLTWANPAAIVYGTALGAAQLNASASVPGTFTYTPTAGTVINAGTGQTLHVVFTPTDGVDYTMTSKDVSIDVSRATPMIAWANPAAIGYGTALGGTQLSATANVPGTFTYTPAAGVVLNAGTGQTLHVDFAPTDAANYGPASKDVTIDVNKAAPTITWANPAVIGYGTALGGTQLNASANVPGTFTFTPAAGAVLNAGTGQTLHVDFVPTDAANYATASKDVTIDVSKAIPTITWAAPAAIGYGTALGATQLNATANVPGTFTYAPASGAVLNAGTAQTLHVDFTPTDAVNYATASKNVTIDVTQATPVITWANPAAIGYGTALGGAQLNATANVSGTFVYTPAAGAVLNAGAGQTLHVLFTPTDSANYATASKDVTIDVGKATPTITWAAPAAISYGTALGGAQLNASANVPGSFVYTPAAGVVLNAGTGQTLHVDFTPTDSANYATASKDVTIDVSKATPVITWANPAAIGYGTALGGAQLNASANVPGTFAYTPASGALLNAGTGQTLHVVFTPTDSANYATASKDVTIDVSKATPVITWASPAAIGYGTALGGTQLNATASVPGTFVYTPAAGAVLNAGTGQTLHVDFTPTDSANYATASKDVTIDVSKATPVITWASPAAIGYGTALGGSQLNASANVPGTFAYTPASGALLNAGTGQTLHVVFTPTDSANYATASKDVTIDVGKATPVITWASPAAIGYGTALGATQLNATANVPGTFTYAPASGAVLNAGTGQALHVAFTPTDSANYATTSKDVTIDVGKATPTITWANPAAISYSIPLGGTQLNATANVPGAFVYTPAAGAVLNAGAGQTLHVLFTPTDSANYATASEDVAIDVSRATPTITWANPAAIGYSTPLGGTQLNATASVPGTFTYTPASGAVLNAGTGQTLHVVFTPTDGANYATASKDVTIDVSKAAPTITWANPAAISYGTALGSTQLNASASAPGMWWVNVPGIFVYTPASGVVLNAGAAQTLHVVFTPTDSADYATAAKDVTIDVGKATPVITWAGPAAIGFGTALGGTQLNATANVPGSFVYTPAAGAVLNAGVGQTLHVIFTPTDVANYATASKDVTIDVGKATPLITWANPTAISYGTALGATQLNASANVPGTFTYTPVAGTVLTSGVHTLSVQFAPTDTGDYSTVAATSVELTVNPAVLTISADNKSKPYDRQPFTTFTVSYSGFVGSDSPSMLGGSLSFGGSAVGATRAGIYTVTPAGLTSSNYTLNFVNGTLTIDHAPLLVSATGVDRPYNQTVAVTVTLSTNALTGDDVTPAYASASFADAHAGSTKPIAVSGITLSGADAGNYTPNTTTTTTASISTRGLTVAPHGVNKPYDGTTGAAVTFTDDRLAGDALTLAATATFATKHVGAAKPVTVTGIAITGGGNQTDYVLTSTTGATVADVTAKPITVTAVATTKAYDNTISSAGAPAVTPAVANGDTAQFAQTYDTKLVGTGKTLTPSGTVLDGNGGADYAITFVSVLTGVITPAAPSRLVFTLLPASTDAGVTSGPIVVGVQDAYGNLAPVAAPLTITLGTSNVDGQFRNAPAPNDTTAITSVLIPANASVTFAFGYQDPDVGMDTVMATAPGLNGASAVVAINPSGLLTDTATTDADFARIDGVDVLFSKGGTKTTQVLKNTNPSTLHYKLTLTNTTGAPLDAATGVTARAFIEVPVMADCGGMTGSDCPLAQNPGLTTLPAFILKSTQAVHATPDDQTDPLPVQYAYKSTGSCSDPTGYSTVFPDDSAPRCIMVSGFSLPKKHLAKIDIAFEFRWKGTDGWPTSPDAKIFFRTGFAFTSVVQVAFTNVQPNVTKTGYAAAGLVAAGQKVTAVGGFVFDQYAQARAGVTVRLFDTLAHANTAGCGMGDGLVTQGTVSGDGFYFVWKTPDVASQSNANAPDLPSGVRYAVEVCSVDSPTPIAARLMSDTLNNKEFDEENFVVTWPQ